MKPNPAQQASDARNVISNFHGNDGSPAIRKLRDEFEQWYVTNSFDYASDPLGSRQCDLQWRAWLAARELTAAQGVAPNAYERGGKIVRTLMEAEKTQFYGDGPIFPLYRHPPIEAISQPIEPQGAVVEKEWWAMPW